MSTAVDGRDDSTSVLAKTRLIIEAFQPEDDDLALAVLVARTGLAKATVHRLTSELVDWGVVERTAAGYRLGLRLFEIGHRVPLQRTLRDAARPAMQDLLTVTRETVHLAVADGTDVLYVEKLERAPRSSVASRLAGRLPLHCTATGKAILAFGAPALTTRVLDQRLAARTPRTVTDPRRLVEQLSAIRRDGVAIEREEAAIGQASIGVPILGPGGDAVAALSLTAPVARLGNLIRARSALAAAGLAVGRALRR
jgi:DNA-binding IclR family transcriptional regulator